MAPPSRVVRLLGGLAVAVIAADVVLWIRVTPLDVGRSDFTPTYVAATLWRTGHASQLYDESLQAPLRAQLIAPDTSGNLPFVNPPPAAVLAAPVSWLPLGIAYRLWAWVEALLLASGVALAARAAPWPPGLAPMTRTVVALLALAGPGTLVLGLQGQWDGLAALALGAGYALLRRGRPGLAGAVLATGFGVVKPHLALGIAAWAVGRRDRHLVTGGVAGLVAVAVASLAVAGPVGCAAFLHVVAGSTVRWQLGEMLGAGGWVGSWLGGGRNSWVLVGLLSALALVGSAALGAASRARPERLEPSLAGATVWGLVASPHLLGHDLVLCSCCLAWCLGATAAADAGGRGGRAAPPAALAEPGWPGRRSTGLLVLWATLGLAAVVDLGRTASSPPGRLVPVVLAAAGVVAWRAMPSTAAGSSAVAPVGQSGRGSGVGGVVA